MILPLEALPLLHILTVLLAVREASIRCIGLREDGPLLKGKPARSQCQRRRLKDGMVSAQSHLFRPSKSPAQKRGFSF